MQCPKDTSELYYASENELEVLKSKCDTKVKEFELKILSLKKDIELKSSEILKLNDKLKVLSDDVSKKNVLLRARDDQLSKAKEEIGKNYEIYETKTNLLQKKLDQFSTEFKNGDVEALILENERAANEIVAIQTHLNVRCAEFQVSEGKLNDQIKALRRKLEERDDDLRTMQTDYLREITDLKSQLKGEKSMRKEKSDQQNEDLIKLRLELESQICKLQQRVQHLMEANEQLKNEKLNAEESVKLTMQKLNKQKDENWAFLTKERETDARKNSLQIQNCERKIEILQNTILELENRNEQILHDSLQSQESFKKDCKDELLKKMNAFVKEKIAFEADIRKQKHEIERLSSERENDRTRLTLREEELSAELNHEKKKHLLEVEQMKKENQDLRLKLDDHAKVKNVNETLVLENSEKFNREIDDLHNKTETLLCKLEESEDLLHRAQKANKNLEESLMKSDEENENIQARYEAMLNENRLQQTSKVTSLMNKVQSLTDEQQQKNHYLQELLLSNEILKNQNIELEENLSSCRMLLRLAQSSFTDFR